MTLNLEWNLDLRSSTGFARENCSQPNVLGGKPWERTSTESSDELGVAAAVEAMSVANGPVDLIEPQRPPGVGEAPDVQPTSFQVVEPLASPLRLPSRLRISGAQISSA